MWPTKSLALAIGCASFIGCTPDAVRTSLPGAPFVLRPGAALVVTSKVPLTSPHYFTALCVQPGPPYRVTDGLPAGFTTAAGKLVRPTVRMRGAGGVEDSFDVVGTLRGSSGERLCFERAQGSVRHSPYTQAVLTAGEEVPISDLLWISADK
jgi:hypothetical protein